MNKSMSCLKSLTNTLSSQSASASQHDLLVKDKCCLFIFTSYLLEQMSLLHDDDSKNSGEDPTERCPVPGFCHLEKIFQTRYS